MTAYHLKADDLWDIWEPLVLEYSLDIFLVLWEAYKVSEKLCSLIVVL